MKIYQSTYLLVTLMLMVSCEPIPFDTTDDEPVFTSDITIDADLLSYEAGVDDYVMTTEVLNVAGYLNYMGILEDIDDPFSNPQFGISFRFSEEARNTDSPDHLVAFAEREYPFYTVDDAILPSSEVSFNADYDGSGMNVNYEWDYGDDTSVEFVDPIHAYPSTSDSYIAHVLIEDDNQCIATAQSTVTFDNRSDCTAKVEVVSINASSAVLEASPLGSEPLSYQWFDGSTDSDIAIDIADTNSNQEFCVTVTNAAGCSSVNCVGIIKNENGTINNCAVSISEKNFLKARSAPQFNSVDVFWTDNISGAQGVEASTQSGIQDDDAYFRITSFEEFEMDVFGNRTVKFDYELKCSLFEAPGSPAIPVEASGTMAVAIPN